MLVCGSDSGALGFRVWGLGFRVRIVDPFRVEGASSAL